MKIKITLITISVVIMGYLMYSNYQLNKRVNEIKTLQDNTINSMNIIASFIQEASSGQFSQYVSKLNK